MQATELRIGLSTTKPVPVTLGITPFKIASNTSLNAKNTSKLFCSTVRLEILWRIRISEPKGRFI